MSFNDPLVTQTKLAQVDASARLFENAQITLFDLFRANMQSGGGSMIEGRTFRNCVIEGPAVILVMPGTRFERTSFGAAPGDIRSILLKPMSATHALGAIPMGDCVFEGCQFFACGFAAHENWLNLMIQELGETSGNA